MNTANAVMTAGHPNTMVLQLCNTLLHLVKTTSDTRPGVSTRVSRLILRGMFHSINDEDIDRALGRFQLQAQLFQ